MAPGQASPTRPSARWPSTRSSSRWRTSRISTSSAARTRSTPRRGLLDHARASRSLDYWSVRSLKDRALRSAFRRFVALRVVAGFRAGKAPERLHQQSGLVARRLRAVSGRRSTSAGGRPWTEWPAALRDREKGALSAFRRESAQEILFRSTSSGLRTKTVVEGAAAVARPARLGRLPVRRGRRQRRRVVQPSPLLIRRVGRRAS